MTTSDDNSVARMRWSGQRTDRVESGALPGLARLTDFVRSVQVPEFRGVTFHEVLAKTALNHVPTDARMLPGEFTINPYRGCMHACQYCFARNTHSHLGLNISGDFDNEIVVKTNIVEVLRHELARRRKLPPRVAFGTNTDVYQRAEGRYALMPGIIDALTEFRIPFSILTKGTMIRRDLDRLARASRVTAVHLGVSLSMMDARLQQSVEYGTATTAARLATVTAIRDAGLGCTVFLSPILPKLSDSSQQLEELVDAVAAAGATDVLFHPLYLPAGVKDVFFAWLHGAHPHLVREYTRLYAPNSRALIRYRQEIGPRIRQLITQRGFPDPDHTIEDKFALNGRRGKPGEQPTQPTLF